MPVELIRPQLVLPDRGELPSNPGWVMAKNCSPYGDTSWIFDTKLAARAVLTDSALLGAHINRQNGTGGWKIYFGTNTRLGEIEPATWIETIHNASLTGVDVNTGWQFVGYGPNEIAVGGHSIECKLRANDSGTFGTMITNSEPEPPGHTASGNWPPRAKFCAIWGDCVALANITDVGPADAFGATCGFLWWVSADDTGGGANTFGTVDTHPGQQTTYGYLQDDHGDITALAGAKRFGAVFKASAIYRVEYYAGEWIVQITGASDRIGTIWPNSVIEVEDEIYFMSLSGPAVLGRSGPPQLLGQGAVMRTLFDDSWVTDGFVINVTDVPYLLWARYQPTQDIVTWSYRSEQDAMEMELNFHRPTRRFSFSQRGSILKPDETTQVGRLLATLVSPRTHLARYAAQQGALFFDVNGNLWEGTPAGDHKWSHKPTWITSYLGFARGEGNRVLRYSPTAVMPHWELIAGATTRPTFNLTCRQKTELGTRTNIATETITNLDEDGRLKFSQLVEAPWAQFEIQLGSSLIASLDQLASFDGFELEFDEGGNI